MTRDEVNRTLLAMERIRKASYEAESKVEERRLIREYDRMSKAIRPYVEFKRRYSDS